MRSERDECSSAVKLPSAPAPGGESQFRQERNLCRKPINHNLKPRPGRNMPLLFTASKLNEGVVAAGVLGCRGGRASRRPESTVAAE